jgi:hypothetical protein
MNITSAALGDPEPSEYEGVEGKGQRVLNGSKRVRLSRGRIIWLLAHPLPIITSPANIPSTSHLSLLAQTHTKNQSLISGAH